MESKYFLVLFSLIFFVGLVFSVPLTGCQVISSSGTYVLQSDLDVNSDNAVPFVGFTSCLDLNADNIEIDGNGHSITGTSIFFGITSEITPITSLNIHDLSLINFLNAINFDGIASTNLSVSSNNFQDIGETYYGQNNGGILFGDMNSGNVSDNNVINFTFPLTFEGGTDSNVKNNLFECSAEEPATGFYIPSSVTVADSNFSGNTEKNCAYWITDSSLTSTNFTNNTFASNAGQITIIPSFSITSESIGSSDLNIGSNSALISTANFVFPDLNQLNVLLNHTAMTLPAIFVDGVLCDSSTCSNLTNVGNNVYSFTVAPIASGAYSVDENLGYTPLTACQVIQSSGTYVLQNDILDLNDVCFAVDANNVILDGNGFSLANQSVDSGLGVITAGAVDNLIIKNFNFNNVSLAIDLYDPTDVSGVTGFNNLILDNNFNNINPLFPDSGAGNMIVAQNYNANPVDKNFQVIGNIFNAPLVNGNYDILIYTYYMTGSQLKNNVFNYSGDDWFPFLFDSPNDTNVYGNLFNSSALSNSNWGYFRRAGVFESVTGLTFQNNLYQTEFGKIFFPNEIAVSFDQESEPSEVVFSKSFLNVNQGSAIIDPTNLYFLNNVISVITLNGIPSLQFPELVNGSSDCVSCSNLNYTNGGYQFNATIGASSETYSVQRHVFAPVDVPKALFDFVGGSFAGLAGLAFVLVVVVILIICVALLYDIFTGNLGLIELLKG